MLMCIGLGMALYTYVYDCDFHIWNQKSRFHSLCQKFRFIFFVYNSIHKRIALLLFSLSFVKFVVFSLRTFAGTITYLSTNANYLFSVCNFAVKSESIFFFSFLLHLNSNCSVRVWFHLFSHLCHTQAQRETEEKKNILNCILSFM